MDEQNLIWTDRYKRSNSVLKTAYEPWLEKWRSLLITRKGEALDVGCGYGFDSEWLASIGFPVTGIDFAPSAIELARHRIARAAFEVVDLRNGLPFKDSRFSMAVASLSLHYFGKDETRFIFQEIRRCLEARSLFLFRLNAVSDLNAGASGTEDSWDRIEVKGVWKQFFTEEKIRYLLHDIFEIESIELMETDRFGKPKALYEVAATAI